MRNPFINTLKGSDLRSIGNSNEIVEQIDNQASFNRLFECIFNDDRKVAMRSIDAVEKLSIAHPEYLKTHKKALLKLLSSAIHKEIKWHVALLISRLPLRKAEINTAWQTLTAWALDTYESKIVRVNSLQGLYELSQCYPALQNDFDRIIQELKDQHVPSITARMKKLKNELRYCGIQHYYLHAVY